MEYPIIFERDAYNDMLIWKKERDKRSGQGARALEIRGPRQCGKTTLMNEFARNNYEQIVSIHLGNAEHQSERDRWQTWIKQTDGLAQPENKHRCIYNLLHRFNPDFKDSASTVILVDEVQNCPHIYSLIRQIAWEFEAHLIISGSYLAHIAESKDYFLPAGAVTRIDLTSLSFVEFLGIFGRRRELYESVDLYGGSPPENYAELRNLYEIYTKTGGYPTVIQKYLEGKGLGEIRQELTNIVHVFSEEVTRYMKSVVEKTLFSAILSGVAELMAKEKKGISDIPNKLLKLCKKEGTLKISRDAIVSAVAWLEECGILYFAHKSNNCKFNDISFNARYYFADIGLASLFVEDWADAGTVSGLVAENFAYLQLKPSMSKQNLLPNKPAFGVLGNGEIDFVVFNKNRGSSYAIEVKSGKSISATANSLLERGIIDFVIYAKGDTKDGIVGNKITIPLTLLGRFEFKDYTGNALQMRKLPEPPKAMHL